VPREGTSGDQLVYDNMASAMDVEIGGWSFGAQFGDLNNDGRLDLYLVNGYVSADRNQNYWYDFSKIAGGNQVVIAHELLHTFGATDKYHPVTNQPLFPDGYAEPKANPPLPQSKAEIMAGRIPVGQTHAEIPRGLEDTVIGAKSAREISWLK